VNETEHSLALDALERIAQHEKECGERWAEAVVELRELRKVTDSHAARWEKLAWLIVGTVGTTALTAWVSMLWNT
jgi:Flp pilus assembly protein TadB